MVRSSRPQSRAELVRSTGSEIVAEYRLYFLDSGNHVGRSIKLECVDDRQAIEQAALVEHVHRKELWQQSRRVWTFEAPDLLSRAGAA
jgi:hypothetical protein